MRRVMCGRQIARVAVGPFYTRDNTWNCPLAIPMTITATRVRYQLLSKYWGGKYNDSEGVFIIVLIE